MTTSNKLAAAVERVAKCRGQSKSVLCEVYETGNAFDAGASYQDDLATLAYAYLDLGKRQPGYLHRDVSGNRTALITTFIREVQE